MDALAGYRVIDLGSAWAAPMAAHLLADMGAEVIKVESRAKMDGMRLGRPMVGEDAAGGDEGRWPELQPVFHGLNRNKQSVTLNLKEPEGIDLLRGLIARSDVVIDNFSPGVMDRLGLDYAALRRLRPDIVVVAMPAAGNSGPLRDVIAYAPIVLALSGLMSLVGYEDGALVGELQSAWSDAVAGLHAAMAAAAALRHRTRTGRGQYVEAAQLESTVSWLGEAVMDVTMNRREPAPIGNAGVGLAPHGVYPCAGVDRWISIAVGGEDEWRGLCAAARRLGPAPWTRDPRFADSYRRLRQREALDAALRRWTVQLRRRGTHRGVASGRRRGLSRHEHRGPVPRPALPRTRRVGRDGAPDGRRRVALRLGVAPVADAGAHRVAGAAARPAQRARPWWTARHAAGRAAASRSVRRGLLDQLAGSYHPDRKSRPSYLMTQVCFCSVSPEVGLTNT